jgi:CheY-like chemotaxis protein
MESLSFRISAAPQATAQQSTPELPLLVIDDNPQNLRLASFLLLFDGLQVRTAASAEEALQLLADQQFSMVVVDLHLPGMNGLELTRRIRNTPAWHDLPVVVVSGYAMRRDDERLVSAGCDGYIGKPFDSKTFPNRVRECLKLRGAGSGAGAIPDH